VALLKQRLTEIGSGTFVAPSRDKFRFADAVDLMRADYRNRGRKSWSRAQQSIRHLEQVFAGDQLAHITTERVDRYVEGRFADGASRGTIVNELAALKRMFTLAQERRKVTTRPTFPKFGKLKNARREFIEDDDLVALLAESALLRPGIDYNPVKYDPEVGARMIRFQHITGWRWKKEVRPLTWQHVDWDEGFVWLDYRETKNDEDKGVPFEEEPDLREIIYAQRAYTDRVEQELGSKVPWLWHVNGRPFKGSRDRKNRKGQLPIPGEFYNVWELLCKRGGVLGKDGKHKIPHDNRRAAVRNLDEAGVSRTISKQWVGHKTDSMYERYNIKNRDDLRRAAAKRASYVAMPQMSRQTNEETKEPSGAGV
jgi:integrase